MAAKPKPDPAPKQTRVQHTLKSWLSNENNTARLKQIITDPVFLAASRYAEEITRVKVSDLTGANALLPEEVVRKTAIHAGTVEMISLFKAFLTPNVTSKFPEPWEHIHPEPR
jgi:hypothetical protein